MRKLITILVFIPLVSLGQESQTNKKNGIENFLKQAKKIVDNIDLKKSSNPNTTENNEKLIVSLWKNYSKSFEYKDYDKLASFFSYPAVFDVSNQPRIADGKESLIKYYKTIREDQIQAGYRYSLLDSYEFYETSKDRCLIKVTYNRFDFGYNKIHTGIGLYYYKKISGDWKLYAIDSL